MATSNELNLAFTVTIAECLKTIESIERDPATAKFSHRMINALHDVLCAGTRLNREELMEIIKFAKKRELLMLQQDAESRMRNLV